MSKVNEASPLANARHDFNTKAETATLSSCGPAGLYLSTLCPKNDTDVTHYRFNPHQPISVIFGRDVAERVCY